MKNITALIAEDEPLLAANLQAELARAWPELVIVANVGHGAAAVEQALALQPDIVFLDIRMPGVTWLDAAQSLAEDFPADAAPVLLVVFVTAYDQYALQAFEHAAVDYVLKPVHPDRLAQTCERLRAAIKARGPNRSEGGTSLDDTLAQLRSLLAAPGLVAPAVPSTPLLTVIQASVGAAVHLVPIGEVLYFEAADKYIRVVTSAREYLIRTSLRDLLPQLDGQRFWQIHRGTVVRADAIATATRDESGKVHLTLRGHADKLVASRLYAHLFKAM
jgi:DNA-binding LytR/AlgR family response regulator